MLHLPPSGHSQLSTPLPILGAGEAPAVHSPTSLRLGWKESVGVRPHPPQFLSQFFKSPNHYWLSQKINSL